MLNLIKNNPFRILGVYANTTLKEITANQTKMKAYLKVGKAVAFPTDMQSLIGSVGRTTDQVEKANAQINLQQDRLLYALYWFVNITPLDKVAFGHLQVGNTDKAFECWNKKECFSSVLNKSTLALMNGNYATAIPTIQSLIHSATYRSELLQSICGDTFTTEEADILDMFVSNLLKEVKVIDILKCFSDNYPDDKAYVKQQAAQVYINEINTEIAKVKNTKQDDAQANYWAGYYLMCNTRASLARLNSILSTTDMLYQQTADRLANQILQLGIYYFNNTDDDNGIDKALSLQEYALITAVGTITKDRCEKNIKILNKRKKEKIVKTDIDFIANALKQFKYKNCSINNATQLVTECKPHLQKIGNILGTSNDFYLRISSAVANNALVMLIDTVNKAQNNLSNLTSLQSTLSSALSAMNTIGSLAMTTAEQNHFNTNKATLQNIKSQCDDAVLIELVSRATTPSSSSNSDTSSSSSNSDTSSSSSNSDTSSSSSSSDTSSSSSNSDTSSSSSSSDTNWGCIIAVIIYVIINISIFIILRS